MNQDISFFFNPKSIAVIGASETPGKVGFSVLNNIIKSGYAGEIYPINPNATTIMNLKTYKSILEIQKKIEVVVFCIPAKLVVSIMNECATKKVKGVIIITAGFKEVGGEGAIIEKEIQKIALDNNIRIIGPNCLGIITPYVNISFASRQPRKGHIAMISQSGAMMTAILDWADLEGIGFSNFVSMGNKSDLDEVDLISAFADDPETNIILVYIESVNKGKKFMELIPKATHKKPVIILKSGISEAGSRAASSHTGALAGNDIAFSIAFDKCGVIRANLMNDLFDMARIFDKCEIPNGKNFAIITNAGGPGIVATDAFSTFKVGLTQFTKEIKDELRAKLPAEAAVNDPVDIIGDATPDRYKTALDIIFKEKDEICAGALVLLTPQAQTQPNKVAEVLKEIKSRFPTKLIVGAFMGGTSVKEPVKFLSEIGIPCYEFPEQAIKAMKYMTLYSEIKNNPEINLKETTSVTVNRERIEAIFKGARDNGRTVLMSSETSEIFSLYGIKNPKTMLARSPKEAEEFSQQVGFPLVMKIVSPDIVHKTDVGGVVLNVMDKDQAREQFLRIVNNVKQFGPINARISGIEIQEMIQTIQYKKNTQLIIGMSRDPQWGPLIMVGLGGIYTNFLKDVSFDLAYKYTVEDAETQISKTKVFMILKGVRGEPKSDIDAVLEILVKLSQLVNELPDVLELDINPLLVFEETANHDGYSAVDIKITISQNKMEIR
jgi:acetyl coenzyme A synthetase (ADP forming)-like protein